MYIRLHKQKQAGKTYTSVLLCESFRDSEKGGAPRSRVLINLGPLDKLGLETVKKLGQGFLRIAGVDFEGAAPPQVICAPDFGHVHAVSHVWDNLGISRALAEAGLNGDTTFGASDLVKLLVVNRICDPCSKLALLEWLDSVIFPGLEDKRPAYQHLLRGMDRLIAVKDKAEPAIAKIFHPKDKAEGDLVFYDITSTWFDGDRSLVEEDIRRYGYLRDKGLLSLYTLEIEGEKLTVAPDKKARAWEEVIDGMLLLETTDLVTSAEEIVKRYKELAEIERGWRALKSTMQLRPVYPTSTVKRG
jgi:hypothetical protein